MQINRLFLPYVSKIFLTCINQQILANKISNGPKIIHLYASLSKNRTFAKNVQNS